MCEAGPDGVAGIDTEEFAHVVEDCLDDARIDGPWLERLSVLGLDRVGLTVRKDVIGMLIGCRGTKLVVCEEIYDLYTRWHRGVQREDVLRGVAGGQRPDADAHGRGRAVVAAGVERDTRGLELGEKQPPFALVGDEGKGGALVGVRRRDVLDLQAGEVKQGHEAIETVARLRPGNRRQPTARPTEAPEPRTLRNMTQRSGTESPAAPEQDGLPRFRNKGPCAAPCYHSGWGKRFT